MIAPDALPSYDGIRAPALLHAIYALVAILVGPFAAPLANMLGSLSNLSRIATLVSLGGRSNTSIDLCNLIFLGRLLFDYEHWE